MLLMLALAFVLVVCRSCVRATSASGKATNARGMDDENEPGTKNWRGVVDLHGIISTGRSFCARGG